jgi:hypothetical protein
VSAPTTWTPTTDPDELSRVIRHARGVLADATQHLAVIDAILARRGALLPESLTFFTVEREAAQYRRSLWGRKLEELETYAHEHAPQPQPEPAAPAPAPAPAPAVLRAPLPR